jgi:hypothetical protein
MISLLNAVPILGIPSFPVELTFQIVWPYQGDVGHGSILRYMLNGHKIRYNAWSSWHVRVIHQVQCHYKILPMVFCCKKLFIKNNVNFQCPLFENYLFSVVVFYQKLNYFLCFPAKVYCS